MNKRLTNLSEKIEEARKALASKKNNSIRRLEDIKRLLLEEIDSHIDALYKKKDNLKEAIRKRLQLKRHKRSFHKQLFNPNIKYLLTIPLIYGMLIPGVFFHICLELYHQICFRVYEIPRVKARHYFVIDRHHLSYLNWFEKLNCVYCGYFNGLMAYASEISSLTELYWCPIKHAQRIPKEHDQYHHFVDYLEGEEYRAKSKKLQAIACNGERCVPGKVVGKA